MGLICPKLERVDRMNYLYETTIVYHTEQGKKRALDGSEEGVDAVAAGDAKQPQADVNTLNVPQETPKKSKKSGNQDTSGIKKVRREITKELTKEKEGK